MKFSKLSGFAKYTWGVLLYNLMIIAWGAYVRASGSGAGCGAHWPLCKGEIIPRAPQIETMIEFAHRISSGLTLVFIAILVVWAWRKFPKKHPVHLSAGLSGIFVITEALLGAGLVLFELVAKNASITRAFSMMLHLENTFLLIAFITLTAWWATDRPPQGFTRHGASAWMLLACVLAVMLLGASGAIAALGDTLFPSTSFTQGFQQDFSPTANILLRLRVLHPIIAVSTALLSGAVAYWLRSHYAEPRLQIISMALIGLLGLQILLGVINVGLLAPIWMQLIHLLVSDLVWLSLVLLVAVVVGTVDLLPRLVDDKIHDRVNNSERVG